MIKIYTAYTNISISVNLNNNKSIRISFEPRTKGSSVFQTADKDVQDAMEKHHQYGKLFKLAETVQVEEKKAEKTAKNELKKVKVSSLEDAKEYLKENFAISWTKLRTQEIIMSVGKEKGVEFVIE